MFLAVAVAVPLMFLAVVVAVPLMFLAMAVAVPLMFLAVAVAVPLMFLAVAVAMPLMFLAVPVGQPATMAMGAVLALIPLQMHVKIIGIQAANYLPPKMQMVSANPQAFQSFFQYLPVRAQIQQRPHCHIPADA